MTEYRSMYPRHSSVEMCIKKNNTKKTLKKKTDKILSVQTVHIF